MEMTPDHCRIGRRPWHDDIRHRTSVAQTCPSRISNTSSRRHSLTDLKLYWFFDQYRKHGKHLRFSCSRTKGSWCLGSRNGAKDTLGSSGLSPRKLGIVIMDHGSRLDQSNEMLQDMAAYYGKKHDHSVVEIAHMEIAGPFLSDAVESCVRQGADRIVVLPFFLAPGRHIQKDVPRLAQEAASNHPGIEVRVASHLGVHPLMADLLECRLQEALSDMHDSA